MARKINYAFKSFVLNNYQDLLKQQKESSLFDYSLSLLEKDGIYNAYLRRSNGQKISSSDLYNKCLENGLQEVLLECYKINHAEYERTKRLKERVGFMLVNGPCVFLTLTFTDNYLKNSTAKERRVAVVRYLKQFNCRYVANIDFGKDKTKTMREHYHALINCDKVDFTSWRKYGNINAEKVRLRSFDDDKTKLSKYIAKLSNHAIKETTKRGSLIYSR